MNQLVYVHGVDGPRSNAEDDPDYRAYLEALAARNSKFEQLTFGGQVTIRAPLWSIFAAHPAWGLACVPKSVLKAEKGVAELGIGDLLGEQEVAAYAPPFDDALPRAARRDLDALVGSLSSVAIEDAAGGGDPTELKRIEDFWAAAAKALDDPDARQSLLTASDDDQFLDRLQVAARPYLKDQTLSLRDDIKKAAAKLTGVTLDIVNSPVVLGIRSKLTPELVTFIGDVFTYLKNGKARENIRNEIRTHLLDAARATTGKDGGRLVALGHSMGGVILYDLLSDQTFAQDLSAELHKPFKVDLLLTVGSQVALFEEIKVFTASSPAFSAAADKRMTMPQAVGQWWNVYNRLDMLSFLAAPVFEGVEDFEASTTAGVTDAHSAYFTNMVFYKRLNDRMKEAGFLP